ncbi:hypothetical protein [Kitasatospora sp. SolWspMP-SS2h]|nr:hypothetical protein [Kitasatospora sp. SolWspMP-SS2h]
MWHRADTARRALAGRVLDHRGGLSRFGETVSLLREYGVAVVLR